MQLVEVIFCMQPDGVNAISQASYDPMVLVRVCRLRLGILRISAIRLRVENVDFRDNSDRGAPLQAGGSWSLDVGACRRGQKESAART